MKQTSFEGDIPWENRFTHGGRLRKKRAGRKARPLSTKHAHHLILKAEKENYSQSFRSPRSYQTIQGLLKKYAKKFGIKIEQCSIQTNHIHLLIRLTKRSLTQGFFRVLAGQIAQIYQREGWLKAKAQNIRKKGTQLWQSRPYTSVIKHRKQYQASKAYIEQNEKEARGEIPYQPRKRTRRAQQNQWKAKPPPT